MSCMSVAGSHAPAWESIPRLRLVGLHSHAKHGNEEIGKYNGA